MPIHIDLWLWNLDRSDREVTALARPLSDDERTRAERFVKPKDQSRFAVARGRMRDILSEYTGAAPDALHFDKIGKGKPVLADGPSFNLSHSGGWAALAVAPAHPKLQMGVDIEAIRPVNPAVAQRSFSSAEQEDLGRLLPKHWMRGFFNGWTRKEAVIKATGHGLTADLQSFDVTLTPGTPAEVRASRGVLPEAADWSMINLDTGPGFCGALAVVTGTETLAPIVLREGRLPLLGTPVKTG
ncbi:MAG: 4'-phosphopantetheinyl transferase superfamily protein [Pseudomonadota bacterium]